jgi:hypothetical protein
MTDQSRRRGGRLLLQADGLQVSGERRTGKTFGELRYWSHASRSSSPTRASLLVDGFMPLVLGLAGVVAVALLP